MSDGEGLDGNPLAYVTTEQLLAEIESRTDAGIMIIIQDRTEGYGQMLRGVWGDPFKTLGMVLAITKQVNARAHAMIEGTGDDNGDG